MWGINVNNGICLITFTNINNQISSLGTSIHNIVCKIKTTIPAKTYETKWGYSRHPLSPSAMLRLPNQPSLWANIERGSGACFIYFWRGLSESLYKISRFNGKRDIGWEFLKKDGSIWFFCINKKKTLCDTMRHIYIKISVLTLENSGKLKLYPKVYCHNKISIINGIYIK